MLELTIAIPTYNRSNYLYELLSQLEKCVCDGVEVLVSDNASNDKTADVVSFFREKMNISYYRNNKNLGFDGNFLNCFSKVKGKYVWLLSDDDYLFDGAVNSILMLLRLNPVCLHLNSCMLLDSKKRLFSRARFKNDNDIIYEDKNDFFERINIFCTFISSLVFKTDLVRSIPNVERFCGVNLLQSFVYLFSMKTKGQYIINSYTCIAERPNDVVSYDVVKTWVYGYVKLCDFAISECGFDEKKVKQIMLTNLSNDIYSFILKFRLSCFESQKWDISLIDCALENYPMLKKKLVRAATCSKLLVHVLRMKYLLSKKIKKLLW